MNINNIFIVFTAYSFLGWCAEVAYQYWTQKKFINRGFLHGPFCPIYGACILLVMYLFVYLLDKVHVNLFTLFIISTILISFIEYITSYILEKLFHLKWWDYTEDPLNLNGRICLHFSLGWGLAAMIVFKIIHPIIMDVINLIPLETSKFITIFIISYFVIDGVITLKKLIITDSNNPFTKYFKKI